MALLRGLRLPLLAVGLLAAAPAAPSPAAAGAPPAPPNGTYTYALSRNGGAQGTTSVVLYRRNDVRQVETSESGSAGAARMVAVGTFRYADLGVDSYVATYQAPFLRSSPLGRTYRFRTVPNFNGQWTVRYRSVPGSLVASIDGSPFVDRLDVPSEARPAVRDPWIFDAPFMTGAMLLPAFRRRSGDASLAPVSEAFPSGITSSGQRLVRATPSFSKTPKNDLALDVPGLARVWYDPTTFIVHEVHFFAANFDARLVSYVKGGGDAVPFSAAPVPAPAPALPRETATFTSADGTSLAALLSRPAGAAGPKVPAIVFVPPGPAAATDYQGDGPSPMYPALVLAFVQRGYAVLRYDMRGVGKSGGSATTQTWDQALADAGAALAKLADDETIDSKRVFLLGYGNGADLALAASVAAGAHVAGVVALGPTALTYRNCAAALTAGVGTPDDAAWRRSALAHDPTALAARAKAPLLVLHPGEPVCAETKDQTDAYDDRLREGNPLATIVAATDLTRRFGSRYEAESPENTEAFFPYVFDASTASAIADWLDAPKTASAANASRGVPAGGGAAKPPPPPGVDKSGTGLPTPLGSGSPTPAPPRSVEPGVVLPSGMTPPPAQVAPPTPIATPGPSVAPAPAITVAPSPAPPANPETTTAPLDATPLPGPAATAS